jgi:phage tail sheath protein FI
MSTVGVAPGVYRQEVFSPPRPTLATGVPVFLGEVPGPVRHPPERLTLWSQFEDRFGGAGNLAHAVRGFFENDGALCYVLPLGGRSIADLRAGLSVAAELDVDLVCAPDVVDANDLQGVIALQAEILDHCDRVGQRFAILDAVLAPDVADVERQRAALGSADAALYHPWLWVSGIDGDSRWVPPCGHIAGTFSRSDWRVGVHKVPANERVDGALDLRVNHTGAELAHLYADDVNVLRAVPGRGIRVWGGRTLSRDPAWEYVSGRRVFHTLGRWIQQSLTDLVYEPNDVRLWVRIMRELTAYLDGLHAAGALRGETSSEAFFVKCDGETNSPEVTSAGLTVVEVGLALVAPAEFVIARIVQGTSGVTVTTPGG